MFHNPSTAGACMTSVRIVWFIVCLLWISAEIRLARKASNPSQPVLDSERQSQRWLWLSIVTGIGFALGFKQLAWLPIPLDYLPRQLLAMPLFLAGLGLRGWAIQHLGHFFTTNVTIHQQHQLIQTGPYRWLRHPAYTGLWLALLAAGLAMGDFLAWACLTVPSFWVLSTRIRIEERMLQQQFLHDYQDYCKSRWRLLPGLY
jgi:protein-S-isoprenylcysteine O-methyltransferase Ste14